VAALPGVFHAESTYRGLGQARPGSDRAVKTIFAHTDPADVAAQWDHVADTVAGSFPKLAAMMAEAKTDVLAFTAFPKVRWQNSGRIIR
jgi:transposase-like protein